MQWSQIKTLFILCFLLLNIYLFIQFIDKQNKADIGVLDNPESTIEQKLESDKIKVKDIQVDVKEASYIKVSQKTYTDADLKLLDKLKNQTTAVINKNFIVSQFNKPITIPEKAKKDDLKTIMESNMIFPDNYVYWGKNEEKNILIFFQHQNNHPIYFNQHGLVLVYLNDKNEMAFYTQTMLGEAEPQGEMKTLNKPIQAVETLYNKNHLYMGDEVRIAEIGYYTRILSEGVQVFAPTWNVSVNDERNYFVNAIEGLVITSNDMEFLETTIESNRDAIRQLDDSNKMKRGILAHLEQLLEESNRSEVE